MEKVESHHDIQRKADGPNQGFDMVVDGLVAVADAFGPTSGTWWPQDVGHLPTGVIKLNWRWALLWKIEEAQLSNIWWMTN